MIPPFDKNGNLPPGEYLADWQEFVTRFGITDHRRKLMRGLKSALHALKLVGCRRVLVDGSFVTDKVVPNDFDGCWEEEGMDFDRLDPVLLDFQGKREAQKRKYLGELFPASASADGFRLFSEFFQTDRNGSSKGIIVIDLVKEVL